MPGGERADPPGVVLQRLDVLDLFASQHGVATVAQLTGEPIGLSRSTVRRARTSGALVTVLPTVLHLRGAELKFHGRAMALLLRIGPTSFISGPSAAMLHGLRGMPAEPIEVTADERHQNALPAWARYATTSWVEGAIDDDSEGDASESDVVEGDVVEKDGLRVASPLRTLFGLAGRFSQDRFERAAEDAWHRDLVTPEDAADYLQRIRRSGKTGVLRFQTWLEKTAARPAGRPSQSNFERDVIQALLDRGLPEPVRQHPLLLLSRETIHLDIAWPDLRYGVEPGHTWWHGGNESMRRDQRRDRACAEIGWLITRLDEEDGARLAAIAAQIERTYLERQRSLGA